MFIICIYKLTTFHSVTLNAISYICGIHPIGECCKDLCITEHIAIKINPNQCWPPYSYKAHVCLFRLYNIQCNLALAY